MKTIMAPDATPVTRFICSSKRCFKVFRSFRKNKKAKEEPAVVNENEKITEKENSNQRLRRESFYFSSTSLRRDSTDSIDTIITLLDDYIYTQDNRANEKLELERQVGMLITV